MITKRLGETAVNNTSRDRGSFDSNGSAQSTEAGFLRNMGDGLTRKSEVPKSGEGPSRDDEVKAARHWVEKYYSSGKGHLHRQCLPVPTCNLSLRYAIGAQTEHLERHLSQYDKACTRPATDAKLSPEIWAQRIVVLHHALADAERVLVDARQSCEALKGRWQRDELTQVEYDALHRRLCQKIKNSTIDLLMCGFGSNGESLADVVDEAGQIINEALSKHDGEMRQKIAKELATIDRRTALAIIQQAVTDGVISEKTADILALNCHPSP